MYWLMVSDMYNSHPYIDVVIHTQLRAHVCGNDGTDKRVVSW